MNIPYRPMGAEVPMAKDAVNLVGRRITLLRAGCTCAESVMWMKDEERRQVLKDVQRILGCAEKVEETVYPQRMEGTDG